jgi:hypothetical protein
MYSGGNFFSKDASFVASSQMLIREASTVEAAAFHPKRKARAV